MSVRLRTLLRRTFAGVRHDIRARRRDRPEGLVPAFDPTMPTAIAHYGNRPTGDEEN